MKYNLTHAWNLRDFKKEERVGLVVMLNNKGNIINTYVNILSL